MIDTTLDNLDYIMSTIGAVLGWYLGGKDGFIIALIVFTSMDYVTGIFAAGIQHKLSSSVGFLGIARKITIFILVGIAHILDKLLGDTAMFRDAVIFFYLANEGISILENAIIIGIPVPEVLKNALEKLDHKHNGNKDA